MRGLERIGWRRERARIDRLAKWTVRLCWRKAKGRKVRLARWYERNSKAGVG